MLHRLACNIDPLISINYVRSLEKIFSKSIGEKYIKDRSGTVKSIALKHFCFKRFQDEITESAHFPHADVQNIAQKPIHLSDCNWARTLNHLVLKRTLNHLAKLASLVKWLKVFFYELNGCGFESS